MFAQPPSGVWYCKILQFVGAAHHVFDVGRHWRNTMDLGATHVVQFEQRRSRRAVHALLMYWPSGHRPLQFWHTVSAVAEHAARM